VTEAAVSAAASVFLLRPRQTPKLYDRPHLDSAKARHRDSSGDVDGLVAVLGLDQKVPAELFACLGERTIGRA
jgi:hypothetical protein